LFVGLLLVNGPELFALERRRERHTEPSTVCHPNGSAVIATTPDFLAAAIREVIARRSL
jgi:hypothetical protein